MLLKSSEKIPKGEARTWLQYALHPANYAGQAERRTLRTAQDRQAGQAGSGFVTSLCCRRLEKGDENPIII
jgi:hypothetical protein